MMLITTGLGRILPCHKILTITEIKILFKVLQALYKLNDSDAVISLNDGSLFSATLANQEAGRSCYIYSQSGIIFIKSI